MKKWIPLEMGNDMPLHGRYIVTCKIKNGDGKYQPEVALAYPGWNYGNNGVIAYMPIKSVAEDANGWYSEYRGDESPNKDGWYFVSLQCQNSNALVLSSLYYDVKKFRWLAVPPSREVVAYMPYPKPHKFK